VKSKVSTLSAIVSVRIMGILLPMAHRKFGASACTAVHGRAHSTGKDAMKGDHLDHSQADHMRVCSHHRRVKTPQE